jgi:iron complex outermembrane receptor protein
MRKTALGLLLLTAVAPGALHANTLADSAADAAADAQTAPAAAEAAPEEVATEIIVTAQKREQRLQDVPIAISAFDSLTLAKVGINRIDQLSAISPGVTTGSYSNSRPQLYIRGVGSRQFDLGADPSVGVFIDDVYVGRFSALLSGLTDVERIEVLKGPQGTLYGRNTIGGAISIVTRRPSRTPIVDVSAEGGERSLFRFKGFASGPLVGERLLASAGVYVGTQRGYLTNLTTGKHGRGEDQLAGRVKLMWLPTDTLTFLLTGDASRDDDPGQLGKTAGPDIFLRSPLVAAPAATPGVFSDFYTYDPKFRRRMQALTLRGELELGGATLTSISAYRHGTLAEQVDVDETSLDINRTIVAETSRELSQELRIASDAGGWDLDGKLNWLVGLFYYHDDARRTDTFVSGPDSYPVYAYNFFRPVIARKQFISNTTGLDRVSESVAVFGQVDVKPVDGLTVTLGLRYSHDRKDGTYIGVTDTPGNSVIGSNFTVPLKKSWHSLDPKVSVSYKPSRDVMLFATYNRGYKSGGFQYQVTQPDLAQQIFNPEKVSYYEGGIKSQWLDRKLTLNLSGFYNDYKNLQVARIVASNTGSPSAFTSNAASSTIKGGEAQIAFAPSRYVSMGVNYAYLDATYDKYVYSATVDFSNSRMVRSPRHTLNANLDLGTPVGEEGRLSFRTDYNYTSSYFFDPGETRVSRLNREGGHSLVDLRVSYEQGPWRFSVYASNVFDERYRNSIVAYPAITTPDFTKPFVNGRPTGFITNPGQFIGFWGTPRTVGATLSFRWDQR